MSETQLPERKPIFEYIEARIKAARTIGIQRDEISVQLVVRIGGIAVRSTLPR